MSTAYQANVLDETPPPAKLYPTPTDCDYYAVYRSPAKKKQRASFIANALARDRAHAVRIAKAQLAPAGRLFAQYIGREGYFAALRSVFR